MTFCHILEIMIRSFLIGKFSLEYKKRDFPVGTVVRNPPANAGDEGSILGPGRSYMSQSN